jgi:WD40 repeat protein
LYGNPLPEGALARMGGTQLRHADAQAAFSSDGKELVSVGSDYLVRHWEVATGRLLRQHHLAASEPGSPRRSIPTLAPNGGLVAVTEKDKVILYETATAKQTRQLALKGKVSSRCEFDPSGKILALFCGEKDLCREAQLCDTKTGKCCVTLELEPMRKGYWTTTFSRDGKLLAILQGTGVRSELSLWDIATGKKVRQATFECPSIALAVSPDGKLLAIGGDNVILIDMASFKEVGRLPLPVPGAVVSLRFSGNGSLLAGCRQLEECILWDVSQRKVRDRLNAQLTDHLAFSSDDKMIAASGRSSDEIQLWDVATGRRAVEKVGHGQYVYVVAGSADGKLVASAAFHDATLRLWDAATGKPLRPMPTADDWVTACAVSADGNVVVSGGNKGTIQIWDTKSGKEQHRFVFAIPPKFRGPARMKVEQVHLSPDGQHVTALCVDLFHLGETTATLRVWDTRTEKLLTDRPFRIDAHYGPNPGGGSRGFWQAHSRFLPDGKAVTVRTETGLTFEDTATGRESVTIAGNLGRPLAISRDGRLVAISEYEPFDDPFAGYKSRAVVVAEVVSGKEVLRLATGQIRHLEFSPDGHFLVTADAASIRLWDLSTGEVAFRRAWPKEIQESPEWCPALSFAIVLGGRGIVTGLRDGTLLVWDVAPRRRPTAPGAKPIDQKRFDELWADLGGDDARKAFRATGLLSNAEAVPFLKNRLKPARLDAQRVEKLLADLDNEHFAVRKAATEELAKMVDLAESPLRRARETGSTLESRRRIDRLLAAPRAPLTGDRLRTLRAISALEGIGSPEAGEVLRHLGTGVESARETREAKQALERLERQTANRPTP